jgi:inner membrane protein
LQNAPFPYILAASFLHPPYPSYSGYPIMTLEWYHWAILGLALVCAELLVPMLVLIWFGLGALVVALLLALLPNLSFVTQMFVWIATSVISVFLWFKVFKSYQLKTNSGRASAEALGEVGLLVSDLEPFKKAKVRFQMPLLGSDVWDCVADQKIEAGTRVKVISVEGSFLKVAKPLQEKQP